MRFNNRVETAQKTNQNEITWGPLTAVMVTIGVFLSSQVIAALIFSLIMSMLGQQDQTSAQLISDSTVGQFLFMATVEIILFSLIFWFIRFRKSNLKAIGLNMPRFTHIGYAILGLFVYFVSLSILTVAIKRFLPMIDTEQKQQLGFQQVNNGGELILVFIALVILPPIVEEILCRGFLFSGLRTKLPIVMAAFLTSIIFAAPHLQIGSGQPLLWIAFFDTFLLSLILVYLRLKTGSLWSSIGLHAIKNCLAFIAVFVIGIT